MEIVKIITNHGALNIQLLPQFAPITVKNFVRYVTQGFYNQTIFHRVIPGFMIQGGGFSTGMIQKESGSPIINEANNGLKNIKYSVAMARTSDPHSASTQFFINLVDNDFLNFKSQENNEWGYAVFGKVIDGNHVIDEISLLKTGIYKGHQDVPQKEAVILEACYLEE